MKWLAGYYLGITLAFPAFAQPTEKERAKELYTSAQAHAKAGACTKAIPEYQEAYRLSQSAEILLPLALCYQKLENFAQALSSYCQFEALAPKTSPYLEEAKKRRTELEKTTGRSCSQNDAFLLEQNKPAETRPTSNPTTAPTSLVSSLPVPPSTSTPATQEEDVGSFVLNTGNHFKWTARGALVGGAFGIWALGIARRRDLSGEITRAKHTQGVIVAGTADAAFLFSLVFLPIEWHQKRQKKKANQAKAESQPSTAPSSNPTTQP